MELGGARESPSFSFSHTGDAQTREAQTSPRSVAACLWCAGIPSKCSRVPFAPNSQLAKITPSPGGSARRTPRSYGSERCSPRRYGRMAFR